MKLAHQIIKTIEWALKILAILVFLWLCLALIDHIGDLGIDGIPVEDWVLIIPSFIATFVFYFLTGFFANVAREKFTTHNKLSNASYLQAFKEVENNDIQSQELWAKAFAKSDGNVEKQKSIYVELRTKQLAND
jgi:hypothetical protein